MIHIAQWHTQAQDNDMPTKHNRMHWTSYTPRITFTSRPYKTPRHISHLIGIPLQLLSPPIHFIMHRTIPTYPRHQQGHDNEMQYQGSYPPMWYNVTLIRNPMNKTPRHDNTCIQAISLAFHHIDLSDTLFYPQNTLLQLNSLPLHSPDTAESLLDHCPYNSVVPTQTLHHQRVA